MSRKEFKAKVLIRFSKGGNETHLTLRKYLIDTVINKYHISTEVLDRWIDKANAIRLTRIKKRLIKVFKDIDIPGDKFNSVFENIGGKLLRELKYYRINKRGIKWFLVKTRRLSQEGVKSYLDYDKDTGIFIRKISLRNRQGDIGHELKRIGTHGYASISINRNSYLGHHLAIMFEIGYWPLVDCDHINGDPTDNRIVNLREVSHQTNGKNCKLSSNNTSGVMGVYRCKRTSKWMVQTGAKFGGRFDDFQDAVEKANKMYEEKAYTNRHIGKL